MRKFSITVRPDSVKGRFFSFSVSDTQLIWLSIVFAVLVIGGLAAFYLNVVVPYETISIRSAEADRMQNNIKLLTRARNAQTRAMDLFNERIDRHISATEKLQFLFGIVDIGGGGYRVSSNDPVAIVMDNLELIEGRYARLSTMMNKLDKLPILFPLDGDFHFSSGFGPRRSPFAGNMEMHKGIDLASDRGTPIVAAGSGTVEVAGRWTDIGNPDYAKLGKFVLIQHGDSNYKTLYGHCSELLVSSGQTVTAGQQIARVGNTGWSTGPHLHFSIIYKERFVDPTQYLVTFDAETIIESYFANDPENGRNSPNGQK